LVIGTNWNKSSAKYHNYICNPCQIAYQNSVRKYFEKVCMSCGKGFRTDHKEGIFCSTNCRAEFHKGRPRPQTSQSLNRFYSQHPGIKQPNSGSFQKGHFVPPEWTESQRKKVTGLPKTPQTLQKISQSLLKFYFEHPEMKEKFSQDRKGDKHWNWKGGKTPELHRLRNTPEYEQWRDAVYSRDGWVCRDCGSKEDLTAHHILSFNDFAEFRFDVQNGVTLCRSCHKIDHEDIGAETRFESRQDFITRLLVQEGRALERRLA
jgi:hypothetical protein